MPYNSISDKFIRCFMSERMKLLENLNYFIVWNHRGYLLTLSHQLVRKIPVQQFLDGEQDDGALFLFPEARDFTFGIFAVIK